MCLRGYWTETTNYILMDCLLRDISRNRLSSSMPQITGYNLNSLTPSQQIDMLICVIGASTCGRRRLTLACRIFPLHTERVGDVVEESERGEDSGSRWVGESGKVPINNNVRENTSQIYPRMLYSGTNRFLQHSRRVTIKWPNWIYRSSFQHDILKYDFLIISAFLLISSPHPGPYLRLSGCAAPPWVLLIPIHILKHPAPSPPKVF